MIVYSDISRVGVEQNRQLFCHMFRHNEQDINIIEILSKSQLIKTDVSKASPLDLRFY